MRKREFRPTLDDKLEKRLVLAGHTAVVLTTNTYSHAVTAIDNAATNFIVVSTDHPATPQDVAAFLRQMKQATKPIPYGNKVLLPALVQTFKAYSDANLLIGLRGGLGNVLRKYVLTNSEDGYIKYIQSNVTHATDDDIPTQGHVAKGSKK